MKKINRQFLAISPTDTEQYCKYWRLYFISFHQSTNLCSILQGSIPDIISKHLININHQKVVGWQRNQRFAKDIIYETPFKAILSINWTKGRSFVIENRRKITTHSNFLLQTSNENVFGYKIENRENISSKYLNMTSLNYRALINQRAYEFLDH